jgi:dipeptide/tripeptide permease
LILKPTDDARTTPSMDQFDETDPVEARSKVAFFSYFYLALNVGSIFSNTVLVYYEDLGQWVKVPAASSSTRWTETTLR